MDARGARNVVLVLPLLYAVSFALFYPNAVTNSDESQFLRQTSVLLAGRSTVTTIDPLTGEPDAWYPSTYPVGTALLMALPVALFGWQGGFLIPCLSVLAAVWITARWLREADRSPLFALLLLGFPALLVMGRVAMSDAPSGALVALGLWLFWRGLDGGGRWWLLSGFVAGTSAVVRVTNPLFFVPLFAGTVLRRDRHCWALVVGGLAGLAVRFLGMQLFFGDVLYERSYYAFAPDTLMQRLPLYLLGVLVLVPGGLALALAYRGRRWPEVVSSVALIFAFYLFQGFSTVETSFPKRVVLALRYFIPLLPLMAFAMAESTPRLWAALLARRAEGTRRRLERAARAAVWLWVGGVACAAVGVHPAFAAWSRTHAEIQRAIEERVPVDAVIVSGVVSTHKLIRVLERPYKLVSHYKLGNDDVAGLIERYGGIYLVFLDRSDSAWWRKDRAEHERFLESLEPAPRLLYDHPFTATDRLRIWRMGPPQAGPASVGDSK